MDHQKAVALHASERYFLGELSESESEAFEAHYFECAHCAEDVRATAALADNAKAIFREAPMRGTAPAEKKRGWLDSFSGFWGPLQVAPAAAAILLAGVVGYQNLAVIRPLRQPMVVSATTLRSATRGEEPVYQVRKGQPFLAFNVEVNPAQPVVEYHCELRSNSGAVVFSRVVPAPRSGTLLNVVLPTSIIGSGHYTFVVTYAQNNGVENFPFVIQKD